MISALFLYINTYEVYTFYITNSSISNNLNLSSEDKNL